MTVQWQDIWDKEKSSIILTRNTNGRECERMSINKPEIAVVVNDFGAHDTQYLESSDICQYQANHGKTYRCILQWGYPSLKCEMQSSW